MGHHNLVSVKLKDSPEVIIRHTETTKGQMETIATRTAIWSLEV